MATDPILALTIRALTAIDEALGLPDDGCNSTEATLDAIRTLRAERDSLREALRGLLDALPSATTHPAIAAARAALATAEAGPLPE